MHRSKQHCYSITSSARVSSDGGMQQIDSQIARYLEGTGGKFTDTVEREIKERLYPHRRDRLF